MAHTVKCAVCGKTFDLQKIQGVKYSKTRYAHWLCYKQGQIVPMKPKGPITTNQNDSPLRQLTDYIQGLFGDCNWPLIIKKIKKLVENKGYTYDGIRAALRWYYEIQGNRKQDNENTDTIIDLVPYIYNQTKEYYAKLDFADQQNGNRKVSKPEIEIIQIKSPIANNNIKLFDLEE